MATRDEILEKILKEYQNPEDLIGKDVILKELATISQMINMPDIARKGHIEAVF